MDISEKFGTLHWTRCDCVFFAVTPDDVKKISISTTIHQKGLKVGGRALFTKIFLQIFNRKGHTHILTKIGEKNPVISAICIFDKLN